MAGKRPRLGCIAQPLLGNADSDLEKRRWRCHRDLQQAELEKRTGKTITDLHRHFIDDLTFEENGKVYRRIPEVFDCWFESGSMPYAQDHFPFENKEEVLKRFPADFIAEGIDQTRGWFYTLHRACSSAFR